MTHSLEVADIGKTLAREVGRQLGLQDKAREEDVECMQSIVENACLLHDIGNPPFGHLGEAAIREWFAEHCSAETDLKAFDGNPQGFRLVSLLSGKDSNGMNLTCSLLLSTVKYPWTRATQPAQ